MTDNIKSLVERLDELLSNGFQPSAVIASEALAALKQQADRIAALESENRELSEFVVAVGGFWGNSKSKLVGEGSLAEVINRAFSECGDSAMATLFEILMQQNIVTSDESYLSLKCIGAPPTESEFISAVQRTIAAKEST